jgi:hypothetical protein
MMKDVLVMRKNYAVIQIWRKGAGFRAGLIPSGKVFETVHWFRTKIEAVAYYKTAPQGQTKQDGECNRMIVKAIRRRIN